MESKIADKTDLRIVKTKRAIKTAFFELMEEIGFSEINVTKIIERAEVNRNTFYSYYSDKYDLLNKMEDELFDGFKALSEGVPYDLLRTQNFTSATALSYFSHLTNYIHENGEIFLLLAGEKGDPAFNNKLNEMIKTVWEEKGILDKISIPQNYAFTAFISMMSGLIGEWVKNGFRETPEEFGIIVVKIMTGIIENIYDKPN